MCGGFILISELSVENKATLILQNKMPLVEDDPDLGGRFCLFPLDATKGQKQLQQLKLKQSMRECSHTLLQLLQEYQHVPLQHKTPAAIAIEPTMTIARVTARTTTRATTPLTTLVMIQSQ